MLLGSKLSISISKTSADASVDLLNTRRSSGGVPEGPMGLLWALACRTRAAIVLVLAALSDSSTAILTDDEVLDLWI
jgi:hypothetical protein